MGGLDGAYEEKLLLKIVCSRSAEVSLRILYNVGSNQAKVYAIHGLEVMSSKYYSMYLADFSDSSGIVNMRGGSTPRRYSRKEVSEMIRAHSLNLQAEP